MPHTASVGGTSAGASYKIFETSQAFMDAAKKSPGAYSNDSGVEVQVAGIYCLICTAPPFGQSSKTETKAIIKTETKYDPRTGQPTTTRTSESKTAHSGYSLWGIYIHSKQGQWEQYSSNLRGQFPELTHDVGDAMSAFFNSADGRRAFVPMQGEDPDDQRCISELTVADYQKIDRGFGAAHPEIFDIIVRPFEESVGAGDVPGTTHKQLPSYVPKPE